MYQGKCVRLERIYKRDKERQFVGGCGGCREMKANGLDLVRDFVMNEREREGEI